MLLSSKWAATSEAGLATGLAMSEGILDPLRLKTLGNYVQAPVGDGGVWLVVKWCRSVRASLLVASYA